MGGGERRRDTKSSVNSDPSERCYGEILHDALPQKLWRDLKGMWKTSTGKKLGRGKGKKRGSGSDGGPGHACAFCAPPSVGSGRAWSSFPRVSRKRTKLFETPGSVDAGRLPDGELLFYRREGAGACCAVWNAGRACCSRSCPCVACARRRPRFLCRRQNQE